MLKRSVSETVYLEMFTFFINNVNYVACDRYFSEGLSKVIYLPFKDKNNIVYHPESNTVY